MDKNGKRKRKKGDGVMYSVPNLQLDGSAIDGCHTSTKLNTDSEIVYGLKPLIRELQE